MPVIFKVLKISKIYTKTEEDWSSTEDQPSNSLSFKLKFVPLGISYNSVVHELFTLPQREIFKYCKTRIFSVDKFSSKHCQRAFATSIFRECVTVKNINQSN